jgi:hypothetical protein
MLLAGGTAGLTCTRSKRPDVRPLRRWMHDAVHKTAFQPFRLAAVTWLTLFSARTPVTSHLEALFGPGTNISIQLV